MGERERRPTGVGIVGLSASGGWAAGAHLPALSAVDGMELTALATSSEASAVAAGAAFVVPGYASVEQLADDENVDLVVVAVKVPRHRELILPVLAAGVPVLSEWPLAVDLAEAEEMHQAASGTRTFVGLQGRSSPTARWLADLVTGGYVGKVLSATVLASSVEWGTPVSERMRYTLDRALGATMLTIAFGHTIDLVSMIVGELQDVVASTAVRRPLVPLDRTGRTVPMTAEDQIAVSGTLPGGAVLSVHHRGGTLSGPGFSLLVDGTEGTLEVTAAGGYPHLGPVTVRGSRGRARLSELTLPDGYDDYPQLAGTPIHTLAHAYAAVRDDLTRGTATAPDFSHAVKRHRLLDAIGRSAAEGRRVSLPGL
ncbi:MULTISPECIES: Gfo/Idh/MocA family oxidoreductase [unclassified Amycolatopsis]|uniref:Gfo/Idh/MocA family protein n=1 Tax=unclassified Amycolatopsis TaxID=2618356 RepID=UPI0028762060|nr:MULTISPECIES: Gfo/Idh/MocA family oxidoreductase [unclassified Amycolatopsis]MDS0135771.1 Gfo/Idh/MocA family oxidoreductase [Amycolatopsis sp. 505]MDS0145628.1 Gfo/Idh/MocA family oxidoreductase [Amycolatopsis sp. CM201R]